GGVARLRLTVPDGTASLRLMLAGRLRHVTGARLRTDPLPVCDGRACTAPDEVQIIDLLPDAGEIVIDAEPLAQGALATPGDARYRH
ncbi:hypothetical protein ACEN88_35685, partial [Massilia sp. CT11-108]|uniref:hypothetical protein n=1 Tax=Massilia sp. CT11-108 TaxID=3393900 RepID=UPI0039A4D2EA